MIVWNSSNKYQYLAAISGSFALVSAGINLGWTSPYLPMLTSPASSIPTTSTEGSWCAAMPLLGAPAGAILAAHLVDRIGRKHTILLHAPTVIICLITMAFSKTIYLISFVRFVMGATEGLLYTVLPMYMGEIAVPNIRGFLTSTLILFSILGLMLINIIGPYTSIFTSSLISLMVPIVHSAIFIWMPQSPYYLVKKQRLTEAKCSLEVLRGQSKCIDEELMGISKAVARQEQVKSAKWLDLFRVASNRRACVIYIVICLTNKFNGKYPCMFYTSMIFAEAEMTTVSPQLSTIVYFTVELLASLLAIGLVDKFGRRPLLITSTLGSSIAMLLLATYFLIKNSWPEWLYLFNCWLPITALVVYNMFFSTGLAFGGVSILSELFPTNIKAVALCTADCFAVMMGVVALKLFQITKDLYGMQMPFWVFAGCGLLGLILIVEFVPETKGKTLEEIQLLLITGSSNKTKKTTSQQTA